MHMRKTAGDVAFDVILVLLVTFVVLVTLYPVIYVASMAISDPREALLGNVIFLPRGFSLEALKTVVRNSQLWRYYGNTLWYTGVGTTLNVLTTVLMAYPLARKKFFLGKFFVLFVLFTMFFNAGIIPNYLVVVRLGLYNSRWALILPMLATAWYVIICRSFFLSLPDELFECAEMEGASEFTILGKIVMPLSKPVIAVLTIYYGTTHWNSFFPALLYLSDKNKFPLQIYLRQVVIQASPEALEGIDTEAFGQQMLSLMQVKYAVVIVAILPVILFYPLLQKYFVKGVLVGAVKG